MKKLILLASSLLLTITANAGCIGSSTLKSCNDSSGNSYTVNKIGNSTYVSGSNLNTGSTWSQSSNTVGNTTYQNGISSNGSSWNQTISSVGSSTTYSGSDSDGNSFYKSCNQFGCY